MNNISLDSIIAFVATVETGSFSAAARSINKSQSSVSSLIANLEIDWNVTLFNRDGKYPVLTDEGQELLEHAKLIVNRVHNMSNTASILSGNFEKRLRIVNDEILPSPYQFDILASFEKANPDVSLSFDFASPLVALKRLIDNEVDVAIGSFTNNPYINQLSTNIIGHLDYVTVVSPDHPLAELGKVERYHLESYRQLALSGKDDLHYLVNNPRSSQVWDSNSYCLLIQGAVLGVGWTSVPFLLVKDEVEEGKLKVLEINDISTNVITPYYMVTRKDYFMTKACIWLMKELTQQMSILNTICHK